MKMITQGSRKDYFYKEFFFDSVNTSEKLADIDKSDVCEGSVAYDMGTSKVYMLNSAKNWIEI